jgi:hypothetical protein
MDPFKGVVRTRSASASPTEAHRARAHPRGPRGPGRPPRRGQMCGWCAFRTPRHGPRMGSLQSDTKGSFYKQYSLLPHADTKLLTV